MRDNFRCEGIGIAARSIRAGDINAAKERERNIYARGAAGYYCGRSRALRRRELSSRRRATGRNIIRPGRVIYCENQTRLTGSRLDKRRHWRGVNHLGSRDPSGRGGPCLRVTPPPFLVLLSLSFTLLVFPSSLPFVSLCSVALRGVFRETTHQGFPDEAESSSRRTVWARRERGTPTSGGDRSTSKTKLKYLSRCSPRVARSVSP